MNSQNFLVILCLFPIFRGLSDVEAKAAIKKVNLFNYDDEVDVFQSRDQQELNKKNFAKKGRFQEKHKSLYPGNDRQTHDMFSYTDYDEAFELDNSLSKKEELHSYPKSLVKYPLGDVNSGFKMSNEDDTNISIRKWNWMEWILRQQPKRQIHGKSS